MQVKILPSSDSSILFFSIDDCGIDYRYEKRFLQEDLILVIVGAQVNPALTISLLTIRKVKPLQCLFYIIGQVLGAFLGAALVYLVYLKQFDTFDGGTRQMTGPNGTADIFFTMPAQDIPHWNTLIDQIVGTAILMVFVRAVTNVRD